MAAGIFLAVAMLLFPALLHSRYDSHIAACQYQLQELSRSLLSYSDKNAGYFPMIPASGNRSVAGIYAPVLVHEGYLANSRSLVCPSSRLAHCADRWRVPTWGELDQAQARALRVLQRHLGGSYGYTLGYLDNGCYRPVRNAGRPYYALLSDAPSLHLPGRQSDNHGGRGQNVLFEDGHVVFLTECVETLGGDALFLNRPGYVEAGVDRQDSVIGDSQATPFPR